MDRASFLETLEREGLSAIWVIVGEKNVYGGSEIHGGFGGTLSHTGLYTFEAGGFSRRMHFECEAPGKDQLQRLIGTEPSAEMLASLANKTADLCRRAN